VSTRITSQPIPIVQIGHVERRVWPADPGAYGGRRARRPGAYEVFIPDEISGRDFPLDGDAVAAVSEATRALQHLEASPPRIATLGALAQNLLRSESVASSRIEGVHLSHKRLARAAYEAARGQRDSRAAEVLGNVEAMKHAIEIGTAGKPLTTSDENDDFAWPHRDGLIWPHFASVVVGLDVA
jgi:Fic/DOC family N-terminal